MVKYKYMSDMWSCDNFYKYLEESHNGLWH